VTLYVAARGSNDRLITTLKPEDFVLKEDEAEQKIVEFTNLSSSFKQEPVSVLLLVDHSMSMKDRHAGGRKFDFVRKAVSKFLDSLQPEDRVMLAGFHQAFWTLSDLTQDKDLIRERLNQEPDLRDRTALLDILPLAIKQMENFPDRKILVLCSDGMDSASRMNIESVVHILQSSDVTVYTIANEFPSGNWGRMILEKISSSTGGYSFFGSSDSDLNKSILQIRTAIGGQYAVGYVPRYPFLHKWREVRVECKVPGIRLHYRNRYLF